MEKRRKKSLNILNSKNEIFNIPFSMETFFNADKSKIFSKINLNLIKNGKKCRSVLIWRDGLLNFIT